jgi:uncharacterized spore protein YtfJ
MTSERFMHLFAEASQVASVRQVFGQPTTVGDKTVIPVGAVTYWFGFGYGSGSAGREEDSEAANGGSGGGGGGQSRARPVAVIEVTPTETRIRPVEDPTRIAMAGIALSAWIFWSLFGTIRYIAKARRR